MKCINIYAYVFVNATPPVIHNVFGFTFIVGKNVLKKGTVCGVLLQASLSARRDDTACQMLSPEHNIGTQGLYIVKLK
jgi:hypothetical protein